MLKCSKKTALILALVMLFATLGTCMVSADGAPEGNLLPNFGFETGSADADGIVSSLSGWTSTYGTKYVTDNDNHFIHFPQSTSRIYKSGIALKPNTSYVVGFNFQASLADSVMVTLCDFKVGKEALSAYVSENGLTAQPEELIQYTGTGQTAAEGATVGKLGWKTAKFEFTTPAYIDSATLMLRAKGGTTDTFGCVDNVYMLEGVPSTNLMANGGFDYFANAEEGIIAGWEVLNPGETDAEIEYLKEDNNTYAKITVAQNDATYKLLVQSVSLFPGNYALSCRHKSPETNLRIGVEGTNVEGTYVEGAPATYTYNYETSSTPGEWKNYTMYFTVTGTAASKVTFKTSALNRLRGTHYYDDFVLTRDETKVDFHSAFKMHPTYDTDYGRYGVEFAPIPAISGGTLDETTNRHTVVSRAHYLPKTAVAESFVFLTCVYKYTGTDKTLESVRIQNKTAQGGVPADAVNTVEVSASAEEGVTYKVESFIWNSLGDLESVAEPMILEY